MIDLLLGQSRFNYPKCEQIFIKIQLHYLIVYHFFTLIPFTVSGKP